MSRLRHYRVQVRTSPNGALLQSEPCIGELTAAAVHTYLTARHPGLCVVIKYVGRPA